MTKRKATLVSMPIWGIARLQTNGTDASAAALASGIAASASITNKHGISDKYLRVEPAYMWVTPEELSECTVFSNTNWIVR